LPPAADPARQEAHYILLLPTMSTCNQLAAWTSICLCLSGVFAPASQHILRASYSSDIGIITNTTSDSALHALCLRSWPAVRLSASTSQSAADATVDFSAPFVGRLSTSAALLYCNNDLRDAFQCIAQPNTALLDCTLYLTYYL